MQPIPHLRLVRIVQTRLQLLNVSWIVVDFLRLPHYLNKWRVSLRNSGHRWSIFSYLLLKDAIKFAVDRYISILSLQDVR